MENSEMITGILGMVLAVLALIVAVMWILFPITVYYALQEIKAQTRATRWATEEILKDATKTAEMATRTASNTARLAEFFSDRNVRFGQD